MASSCSSLCVASTNATPFLIRVQDALVLDNSAGFQILRQHLSETVKCDFCPTHEAATFEDRQAWVVIRDILHALLAPIVALEEHATRVAQLFTKSYRPADWEYAYHGKARNAFVWLQSFLMDDMNWCLSVGCPGKCTILCCVFFY